MSLAPGVPLDEKTVAGRYAVSRSPVREAIIRLSADGLVRTPAQQECHRFNRSTSKNFPIYMDALDLMQRVTTRLAAMHRTDEELRRIKQKHRDFERARAAGDALSMIETNRDFHTAIAEAGKNRYFTMLYTRLLDEGRRRCGCTSIRSMTPFRWILPWNMTASSMRSRGAIPTWPRRSPTSMPNRWRIAFWTISARGIRSISRCNRRSCAEPVSP